jgi:two-component system response regulator RpfG
MPEDEVRLIELAAPLHDMGKIAIPDSVLMKPGPLTKETESCAGIRRSAMSCSAAARTASSRPAPPSRCATMSATTAAAIPMASWAMQIPLEARIVAVADVFDALISPRPYKKAWDRDAALAYLYAQRGRLFDPACVDALGRGRAAGRHLRPYSTVHVPPGME